MFERAQDLYNEDPTPTPGQLADRLSLEQDDLGETPSANTLREWIAKRWITLDPADAPWSLADASGEDGSLVLDVMRVLIEDSGSGRPWPSRPSRKVAAWIVRIRRAYRDLDDMPLVFVLASLARRGGQYLSKVETFLAFTPWRDEAEALARAIEAKTVSFEVAMTFGIEEQVTAHRVRWRLEQEERGNG